ncbi:MAG TPA: cytochrome c, partial [Casimicrobiaceae bacterium]|nr:cytochrome c [Casimicrobiaceae bacterium]
MKRALGLCALALFGLGCGLAQPARAASEAGRDLRLEVALIAADARMLADPATPPGRRAGLAGRIRSSLGSLAVTARYAMQAEGWQDTRQGARHDAPSHAELPAAIAGLRALFDAGELPAFSRAAAKLAVAYPVGLWYFQPLTVTPGRLKSGRATYERYCIGCHASPDPNAANPAPDLFRMAQTGPPDELIERLLAGVHGDRTTSLENPFSDEEIAGLAAYFVSGGKD